MYDAGVTEHNTLTLIISSRTDGHTFYTVYCRSTFTNRKNDKNNNKNDTKYLTN